MADKKESVDPDFFSQINHYNEYGLLGDLERLC